MAMIKSSARLLLSLADRGATLGLVVAALSLATMLIYTTISVLGRFSGWFTWPGAEQLGGYTLAFLIYFGLAHSFRSGSFIRMMLVHKRVPARLRSGVEIILYILSLTYVVILTIYFFDLPRESYDFGVSSTGTFRWPLFVPQLALGLGTLLLGVQISALLLGRCVGIVSGKLGVEDME